MKPNPPSVTCRYAAGCCSKRRYVSTCARLSDFKLRIFVQMADGTGLGEGGSVLDFMSMKSYPDMSLDMSMLNSLGDYPCLHSEAVTFI